MTRLYLSCLEHVSDQSMSLVRYRQNMTRVCFLAEHDQSVCLVRDRQCLTLFFVLASTSIIYACSAATSAKRLNGPCLCITCGDASADLVFCLIDDAHQVTFADLSSVSCSRERQNLLALSNAKCCCMLTLGDEIRCCWSR